MFKVNFIDNIIKIDNINLISRSRKFIRISSNYIILEKWSLNKNEIILKNKSINLLEFIDDINIIFIDNSNTNYFLQYNIKDVKIKNSKLLLKS